MRQNTYANQLPSLHQSSLQQNGSAMILGVSNIGTGGINSGGIAAAA